MGRETAVVIRRASNGLELSVQCGVVAAEVVHIWHGVSLVTCLGELSECGVVDLLTSIQVQLSEVEWIGVLSDDLKSLVTDMLAVAEAENPELIGPRDKIYEVCVSEQVWRRLLPRKY